VKETQGYYHLGIFRLMLYLGSDIKNASKVPKLKTELQAVVGGCLSADAISFNRFLIDNAHLWKIPSFSNL
jgi:hypothetical protein